ncbi:type VI secretion system-associated protein TagF, partial [Azospirillum doebereinerae]|uniref:type VI secretion system-associated protein TagF n=1 Tax=Azospirillum doebereinerae TaxID=92933 RepID=UPI001EE58ECD
MLRERWNAARTNASAAHFHGVGFHGKLPARGDFVGHGLPREVLDPWDVWLSAALGEAGRRLGGAGAAGARAGRGRAAGGFAGARLAHARPRR